jgi:hypothetical protein
MSKGLGPKDLEPFEVQTFQGLIKLFTHFLSGSFNLFAETLKRVANITHIQVLKGINGIGCGFAYCVSSV